MAERAHVRAAEDVNARLDADDPGWRAKYNYSPAPPDDGRCRVCYEWRPHPPSKAHFGFIWWRTCERDCEHAHHDDEVWLG